jgi:hypothetical protein
MTVSIDLEKGEINMPDIGVTYRTLLAVAGKGFEKTKRRSWRVMLRGETFVGTIRVRTFGFSNGKSLPKPQATAVESPQGP